VTPDAKEGVGPSGRPDPGPADPGDGGAGEEPAAVYARRRDRFGARRDAAADRARRLATGRTLAFAAALALGVAAEWTSAGWPLVLWSGAVLAVLAFVGLVVRHRRARESARRAGALSEVNARALARLRRDWDALSDPGPAAGPPPGDHPYASDLSLFGAASVRALLDAVSTAPGASRLRSWLLEAARPGGRTPVREAERRRELVDALARRVDLRDRLAAEGRLSGRVDPGAVGRFLRWAEARPWLPDRPGVRWAAWALPLSTWALGAAHLAGLAGRPWWIVPVAATLVLAHRTSGAVHRSFDGAEAGADALDGWAGSLELVAGLAGDAELDVLAAPLAGEEEDAPDRLRDLDGLVHLAGARHGLMHFFLQVLFLWDLHVLRGLERWRRDAGGDVRAWIDALARADALAALAALRHAHPDWAFADLRPGGRVLEAEGLGHPLLAPGACVRNDVTVGPPGTVLLVTGSNMSGKSTLLRALGLNVVLARTGAPVCARSMELPPLAVHTSLRVEDSVVRGVSQYMAELERVRDVVASARALDPGEPERPDGAEGPEPGGAAPGAEAPERPEPDAPGRPALLYLLDEPLQGTNEAERREAVRVVLRELLARGAVGAVATHDLRIHETGGLREAARPVHFRGRPRPDADGPSIDFDYRLREGPATSTNALELLRLAGLDRPDPRRD
jgi:hypothetical protein